MSFVTALIISAVVMGVASYLLVGLIGGTVGWVALGLVAVCVGYGVGAPDRRKRRAAP